jgi:quercetin dioxygenase-like cupin family protein
VPSEYRVEKFSGDELPRASDMRRRLESEGYRVYEWSDAVGSIYEAHEHANDQIHWVIAGSIELDVEGFGKVVLNAGDRDEMPAGTRHSAAVVGSGPVRYLIGEKQ